MTNQSTQTNTTEVTSIAEKLCIIVPQFRLWTGTTVLRETEIEGKLPPKKVISDLGQKNVINPKSLDGFTAIKARAMRFLQDNGVAFLGGYAVPLERTNEIVQTLEVHVKEYEQLKTQFLNRYDELCNEWVLENPEFASQIKASLKPKSEVESKIFARYSAIKVQPVGEDQVNNFNQEVNGLSDDLLASVARQSEKLFRELLTRGYATQRVLPMVRRIHKKLDGLSFLDGGIVPIVNMIESLMARMPAKGCVEGSLFWELQACMGILSDVHKMEDVSTGKLTLSQYQLNFIQGTGYQPNIGNNVPVNSLNNPSVEPSVNTVNTLLNTQNQGVTPTNDQGVSSEDQVQTNQTKEVTADGISLPSLASPTDIEAYFKQCDERRLARQAAEVNVDNVISAEEEVSSVKKQDSFNRELSEPADLFF